MSRIGRYELGKRIGVEGAVATWRARDTEGAGADVILELTPLSPSNKDAVDGLRRLASERQASGQYTSVRVFEDTSRGMMGVATVGGPSGFPVALDGPERPRPVRAAGPTVAESGASSPGAGATAPTARRSSRTFLATLAGSVGLAIVAGAGAWLWTSSMAPTEFAEARALKVDDAAAPSTTASSAPRAHEPPAAPDRGEWEVADGLAIEQAGALGCEARALRGWFRLKCRRPRDVQIIADVPREAIEDVPGFTVVTLPMPTGQRVIDFEWKGSWGQRTLTMFGDGTRFRSADGKFDRGPTPIKCTGPERGSSCCQRRDEVTFQKRACDQPYESTLCRSDEDCPRSASSRLTCRASPTDVRFRTCQ